MEAQENEFCIMGEGSFFVHNHLYRFFNHRINGTARHEIFFGTANRKKSIKTGLVVFLKPEDHNMSEYGVHGRYGHDFDLYLKQTGQRKAMEYYKWSVDDFRKVFGKSYL